MSVADFNKAVDFLMSIQKIDYPIKAAIATIAFIVVILTYFDVLWFKDVSPWVPVTATIIFLLFVLLPAYKRWEGRIRRPFNKLSDIQKELLTKVFRNNSRKFRFEPKDENKRERLDNTADIPQIDRLLEPHDWDFEVLINDHYIEAESKIRLPEIYSVTITGWNELKKNLAKSK